MIMNFDKNKAGVLVYSSVGSWSASDLELTHFTQGTAGSENGYYRLTGWYKNKMYQDVNGRYIDMTDGAEIVSDVQTKSSRDAQNVVNGIISNNKHVYENNLICARFVSKLDSSQKETLYGLQSRLVTRNEALLNNNLIQSASESYPKGYINFIDYLNKFMSSGGIGLVLTTGAVIVIGAVIIAALSTAAYFAYSAFLKESKDDVKFSDDLTKILTSKLTAEEYEQLKTETAGLITKAKLKAKLTTYGSFTKYAVIGLALFLVVKNVNPNKIKNHVDSKDQDGTN